MDHTLPLIDNIPSSCIYAFIANDGFYIGFSNGNAVVEIAKHIQNMRLGVHDSPQFNKAYITGNIELRILESFVDTEGYIVKSKVNAHIETLVGSGLTNYNPSKRICSTYKLKIQLLARFNGVDIKDTGSPYVYVYAESKRRDRYIIAIFYTLMEAEEYVNGICANRDNIIPWVYNNDLTIEYVNMYGFKLKIS